MIITNNPMVYDEFGLSKNILYLKDEPYIAVLEVVRDEIHKGRELLTHPLSGSIKPNETPYKTVILSKSEGRLDLTSLAIIEDSIVTAHKFSAKRQRQLNEKLHNDFQLIDYSLIADCIRQTKD